MKCPSCQQNNADAARFCLKCGALLRETERFTVAQTPASAETGAAAPFSGKPVPVTKPVAPVGGPGTPQLFGGPSIKVPSPGMCYYHQNLRATYICSRCGRQVCRDCAKAYVDLIFCPPCYAASMP